MRGKIIIVLREGMKQLGQQFICESMKATLLPVMS